MKQLNDIDKIFKDALDGRREVVPPDIWKAVNESINKNDDVLKINHNRFKSLIKLLGLLIFSSAIFFANLSSIKESITIKHTTASDTWLHTDSSKKVLPIDKPSMQLSKNKLRLSAGDSADAAIREKTYSLTDTVYKTESLKQYNIANLSGSHQKITYPTTTPLSIAVNSVGQSHLYNKKYDYHTSSPTTKQRRLSRKENKYFDQNLIKTLVTKSGKLR